MSKFKLESMQHTRLRDVLFNMHTSSGATDEYRRGIIVGVVAALMAADMKLTFKQAISQVCFHMPDAGARISPASVPEAWVVEVGTEMTKYGKTYICPV